MPRRVRIVRLDNLQFHVAPMLYDQMEVYLKTINDLRANSPKPEDFAAITLDTVVEGLNAGGHKAEDGGEFTRAKLTAEVDSGSINELYDEILRMSGIVTKTAGEAAATSTSR